MSRCGQRPLQFADTPFAIARETGFDSSRHLSTACRSASAPHCAVPPVVRIVSRGPAVNNSLHQTTRTSHTSTATKTRIPLMGSSWSWSRGRRSLSVSRQARFRRTRRFRSRNRSPRRSRAQTAARRWFPDGSRLLIAAQESKRPPFLFVQDVAGGAPRRLVEGAAAGAVSPDGRIVASMGAAGSIVLTPVDGSQSRTLTGVPIGASISRWEASGRYVFLKASGEFGVNVFRVDVATGHAEAWRTLAPSDVAGVRYPTYSLAMTPDGQSYCYSYGRRLSTLFVVNGLK